MWINGMIKVEISGEAQIVVMPWFGHERKYRGLGQGQGHWDREVHGIRKQGIMDSYVVVTEITKKLWQ